jgi:hypothetical protein
MSTVRKHTRITAKGKRVTVRRHERDDDGPGGSQRPGTPAPDPWPAITVSEPAVSRGGDETTWAGIVHDDNLAGAPDPRDVGPNPYPRDMARAEQFADACEHLGLPPELVMKMPAVRDRIMRAIG